MACVLAVSVLFGQVAKKPIPPISALVTDTHGQVTTVTDLKAIYVPEEGYSDRDKLIANLPTLGIILIMKEGRVTTERMLNIPFAAIRRLSFPADFKLMVERRDGTVLVLDQLTAPNWTLDEERLLEERNTTGAVTKSQKLYDYKLAAKVVTGIKTAKRAGAMHKLFLSGFEGVARTSSGQKGDFDIGLEEVRSIEFK